MNAPAYPSTQLLIAGQWCDAASGRTLPVVNPASGAEIGRVAHAGLADLDRALAAADKGFALWRATPAVERAKLMRAAAVLLKERASEIATMMSQEQGKPLAEAKGEVLSAADIIEWFADESRRIYGRIVPPRNMAVQQSVLKEPVGPVAAFTPWNFPINQVVRKVCAALSTGCSIIVKAPEETPASPAALMKAFADAGVPAGVIGLVYGDPAEISGYLIPHPVIRKITFTGSTPVGKQLAALAGLHMKRATMELGGHAPVVVCDDADIDNAVKLLVPFKFRNAGQVCISPTRFYVQEGAYEKFVEAFVAKTRAVKVGDGLLPDTRMGPLAHARRVGALASFIDDAQSRGATVLAGGAPIPGQGSFFAPTVITDLPEDSRLMTEEPFGPVAGIVRFKTVDEVLKRANSLAFGLAAYAFTGSTKNAQALSAGLEAGMVSINHIGLALSETPFGGIKDSGIGSEGGSETFDGYLNTKFVTQMG